MMKVRSLVSVCAVAIVLSLVTVPLAEAQFGGVGGRLIRRAGAAAEDEVARKVDATVRGAVRCAVGDYVCVDNAKAKGQPVVMTDRSGNILTDDNGNPITDPGVAAQRTGAGGGTAAGPVGRPGEGAWANYDFMPGDRVIFTEDFTNDRVGNFPRRFDLVAGNWEVVEWQGGRYLRSTSDGAGTVSLTLPETLPERFTIEFPASVQHGNANVRVSTAAITHGDRAFAGSAPTLAWQWAGLAPVKNQGPSARANRPGRAELVTVRVMADGNYMKMFVNEQRVANAPNAVFPRTNTLFFSATWASVANPILIGPVTVTASELSLYDAIERDGRVALQGIYFDVNSDVIRPESTGTLDEIGYMLREHPGLRLTIEGHTDSDGDDAHNLELSGRRAAAVKTHLVSVLGIDGSRLETVGFGESRPSADNSTPEGKQQNRRVELVRLDG